MDSDVAPAAPLGVEWLPGVAALNLMVSGNGARPTRTVVTGYPAMGNMSVLLRVTESRDHLQGIDPITASLTATVQTG